MNALWLRFKHIVSHCTNNFILLRLTRPQKKNPCITREVLHAKRKVKRLRTAVKQDGGHTKVTKLRSAIASFKNTTKKAREHYFNTTLPSFITGHPQRFWKHFRPRKAGRPTLSLELKRAQCNAYNNFFHSVFTKDNGHTPQLLSPNKDTINPINITDEGICSLLLELDPKKASGPDNIQNAFLRRYAEWCSKYLGLVFRKSFSLSQLPQDWKKAKVTPIPKSGDCDDPCNCRPISLTSTSCNIFEHIILKHLTVFLETKGILSPCQHGFRSRLSTITQLTEVVHDLAMSINNCSHTDVILLDFSKAFDSVCHNTLFVNLRHTIADGPVTRWIGEFLSDRSQFVMFEQVASETVPVISGVPQGSVLGPLLFLILINNITKNVSCNIKLFADDCIVYKEITSYSDHLELAHSLNHLAQWCTDWQMSINLKKTVCMSQKRKKDPVNYVHSNNGVRLERVNQHKYLGVTITSQLRWDAHIHKIKSNPLRKLLYLRKCLRMAPQSTKLLAYTTYVRPVLEYASTIWFPQTVTSVNKLEKVERKAARFICNRYRRTYSPTNMLSSCGLPTLAARAKQARLKFFFS